MLPKPMTYGQLTLQMQRDSKHSSKQPNTSKAYECMLRLVCTSETCCCQDHLREGTAFPQIKSSLWESVVQVQVSII